MIKKISLVILTLFAFSCGMPRVKAPNKRWDLQWSSIQQVIVSGDDKKQKFWIFAADWCLPCVWLKEHFQSEGGPRQDILFLNTDEEWVMKLVSMVRINEIPTLIHFDENGKLIAVKSSPRDIINYLHGI